MDINADETPYDNDATLLSYDQSIPYEEQVSALPPSTSAQGLASRISANKLYLLSESSRAGTRAGSGKVRAVPGVVNVWVA